MDIQTWIFSRYFQKNEQRNRLSLQEKQMTAFVVNVKTGAFKWKLESWKMFTCHWELGSLPIHYDFSHEINGDISKCDSWRLFNEIYQILEICITACQYFPNDPYMKLQNPPKRQYQEVIPDTVSASTLKLIQTIICRVLVCIKEYSQLLKKTIKIFFPYMYIYIMRIFFMYFNQNNISQQTESRSR